MASVIHELITVLNEQAERHSELLGLSLEEKDAIIQNDIECLQKLVGLKNIVISQSNRLEKRRIALVQDIILVMGNTDHDMDLGQLIQLMQGKPEEEELRQVGKRLRDIVTELKEVNDLNKELLETSLEFVEYSLNALRTTLVNEPADPLGKSQGGAVGTFNTRG